MAEGEWDPAQWIPQEPSSEENPKGEWTEKMEKVGDYDDWGPLAAFRVKF